jgi:hypothetical protein
MKKGRAAKMTHDYSRNGTTTLEVFTTPIYIPRRVFELLGTPTPLRLT